MLAAGRQVNVYIYIYITLYTHVVNLPHVSAFFSYLQVGTHQRKIKLTYNHVHCIFLCWIPHRRRPKKVEEGRRRTKDAEEGWRRPKKAEKGRRMPKKAEKGRKRPKEAEEGRRRPKEAEGSRRRPKKTETFRRITTCACIVIYNYSAVVGTYLVTNRTICVNKLLKLFYKCTVCLDTSENIKRSFRFTIFSRMHLQ